MVCFAHAISGTTLAYEPILIHSTKKAVGSMSRVAVVWQRCTRVVLIAAGFASALVGDAFSPRNP